MADMEKFYDDLITINLYIRNDRGCWFEGRVCELLLFTPLANCQLGYTDDMKVYTMFQYWFFPFEIVWVKRYLSYNLHDL